LGSRCWIRTKAMPGAGGRLVRKAVKASRPPAEAPTPTTGKEGGEAADGGAAGFFFRGLIFAMDRPLPVQKLQIGRRNRLPHHWKHSTCSGGAGGFACDLRCSLERSYEGTYRFHGQSELHCQSRTFVGLGPYPAAMGFNDGTADREPQSHA